METITIVGPESAVTAVPRILGFAPENSLVILWIRSGSVVLAQRSDVPICGDEGWAPALARIASRVSAEAVLDIWVAEEAPADDLVDGIHLALADLGIPIVATIATDGRTWYLDGFPFGGIRSLPEALGWQAPPRSDFQVTPTPGVPLIRRARALTDRCQTDTVITRLIEGSRPDAEQWSQAEMRQFVCGLQDVRVRDCVLWHACAEPGRARALGFRLATLLRRVDRRATGEVAITAAMAFWVAGDGYRASVVLERVLADAPDHILGHMLDAALRSALPPLRWVDMMRNTPYEDCRRGRVCAPSESLYILESG
jgi:hypothetical protein